MENKKRIHMKHQMSGAADQAIEYEIDVASKTVEIAMQQFDSALFALFVTRVLEDEGIIAFTDDQESGYTPKRPEWKLFATFAGVRLRAEVYKLAYRTAAETVVLSQP